VFAVGPPFTTIDITFDTAGVGMDQTSEPNWDFYEIEFDGQLSLLTASEWQNENTIRVSYIAIDPVYPVTVELQVDDPDTKDLNGQIAKAVQLVTDEGP